VEQDSPAAKPTARFLIKFRGMAQNERRCFNRLQTSFILSLTRSWSWSSNHGSSKVRHDLVPLLERVPIKWNHSIDKDALKIKELEHVLIEKVEQLFRDMP
jgi:hypothetical protein